MSVSAVKVLDYANRTAELEADNNPFAHVVLAHLKALETRRDPEERRAWKFRLVRGLYERGFKAEDVRKLFRLIDWLMELPLKLDKLFWKDVHQYEEKQIMPFITTPERIAIKDMMLRLIGDSLQAKFGEEGAKLMPDITDLEDIDKYTAMNIAIANPLLGAKPLHVYAVACRATKPGTKQGDPWQLETWLQTLQIGQPLPTLPLWLADSLSVRLDLEESYEETCKALRIP